MEEDAPIVKIEKLLNNMDIADNDENEEWESEEDEEKKKN